MHLIKLILKKITGKAEDPPATLSSLYRVFLCIRSPQNSDTTVRGGRPCPVTAYGRPATPAYGLGLCSCLSVNVFPTHLCCRCGSLHSVFSAPKTRTWHCVVTSVYICWGRGQRMNERKQKTENSEGGEVSYCSTTAWCLFFKIQINIVSF